MSSEHNLQNRRKFFYRSARIFDVAILIELQRCGYLCKLILL